MLRALGLLLTLFFFVFTANASDSSTDDENLTKVFGPKKFKGQLHNPPTKSKRFSIQEPEGDFLMIIQNGKKFVPKDCSKKKRLRARLRCKRKNLYRKIRALRTRAWRADISINDQLVVTGHDINPTVGELRVPVDLEALNIMKAKVKGLRGSFIKVSIFQDGSNNNQAPLAVFSSELDPQNSLKYSFDASDSSDDDGIVSFDWDFGDGNTASGESVMHEYAAPGEFTVTLTVTDTDGVSSTASETLTVIQNGTPVAVANANQILGRAPIEIFFNANGTTDPDGDPLDLQWTFSDDNSTESGQFVSHTFLTEGTFTATLRATDPHGAFSESIIEVTILPPGDNDLPVADLVLDPDRDIFFHGEFITFDGSGSDDPDGQINSYHWDFNGQTTTTFIPSLTLSFSTGSEMTVTLVVEDSSGGLSAPVSVVIALVPPTDLIVDIVSSLEPLKGSIPLDIDFEAVAVSPDAEITQLTWEFSDGTTIVDQQAVSHTFTAEGVHTVTLTAVDANGASKSETISVVAFDQSPIAFFEASEQGLVVDFDASLSAGPDSIVSYSWDFDDGSSTTSSDPEAQHTYGAPGTYNVTLTIEDGTGATDTISILVDIN